MTPLEQPLCVEVHDGKLVISVGIDTLAFAAEHCNRFYDGHKDAYTMRVTDKSVFAREVVRALLREEEDGTTLVHVLLDDAFEAAVGDGCDGVKHGDTP